MRHDETVESWVMTCYDHFTALGMVLQQILFLPVLNYQSADNFRRRASLFGLTLAPMQRETAMARSQFSQAAYALVLCISSKMWIWNHIEIWLIARLQTWTCGRTSRRASPLSLSSMSKRSLEDCLSDQSAMFVKYLSNARLCWSFWGLDWPSLAGRLLGIRGGDFICFYDWTEQDTEICQTAKQMGGSKM